MKLKSTTKQPGSSRRLSRGRANLASLHRMTEAQIARTSPPELSDLPSDFWDDAVKLERYSARKWSESDKTSADLE